MADCSHPIFANVKFHILNEDTFIVCEICIETASNNFFAKLSSIYTKICLSHKTAAAFWRTCPLVSFTTFIWTFFTRITKEMIKKIIENQCDKHKKVSLDVFHFQMQWVPLNTICFLFICCFYLTIIVSHLLPFINPSTVSETQNPFSCGAYFRCVN